MQEITSKDFMERMPNPNTATWEDYMDWMFPPGLELAKKPKDYMSEE